MNCLTCARPIVVGERVLVDIEGVICEDCSGSTDYTYTISAGGSIEIAGKRYVFLRIWELDHVELLTNQHAVESDRADAICDEWNSNPTRNRDTALSLFAERMKAETRAGHVAAIVAKDGRVAPIRKGIRS